MSDAEIIKFIPRTSKLHKCDVCQQSFEWGEESRLWGSIGHEDIGARQFKVCSDECCIKAPKIYDLEYIVGNYKCSDGGKVVHAHWDEWDNKTGRFSK